MDLKTSIFTHKSVFLSFFLSLFLLIPFSATYAESGCCAGHGGVSSCNMMTGHQLCKDKTDSPTCLCEGKKSKKATTQAVQPAKTTTTKPMKTTTTKPAKAAVSPVSTAGCCSGHGGVAHCDKKTGYQVCKDKTKSTTCKCN